MAQHPSLRSKKKSKKYRSVLKRFEKVKELKEKEKWKNGDSIFGLPKLKIIKFKLKKEKVQPAAEGVEAEAGAEGVQGQAAPDAKATGKEAPKKEGGKKEGGKKEEKK